MAVMAISAVLSGYAQKTFEGSITYKIEYMALPPEMDGMESMLPQESMVYYRNGATRSENNTMGGMQVAVEDPANDKYFVLMDMLGQKICIETSEEELGEMEKQQGAVEVDLVKGKKEIAGHNCKKAVVNLPDNEVPITLYYAPKLKSGNNRYEGIEGIPLQFGMHNAGVQARLTAIKVEKMEVDPLMFTVPEGYEMMSSDGLMKMLSGDE